MVERIVHRVDTLADFPDIGLRAPESDDENVREVFENPYRILSISLSPPVWISSPSSMGVRTTRGRSNTKIVVGRSLTNRCS